MSRWTIERKIRLLEAVMVCIEEHPIVGQWITEILDRKTENCSEKPNNCEELNAYRECIKSRSFWDSKHCDGCYFDERCPFDEPKTDPQTDEEQFCRDHKCTFYRPQEGGCTKNTGDCPFNDEPQTDEEYINNLPWTEVGNGEQTDCAWKKGE